MLRQKILQSRESALVSVFLPEGEDTADQNHDDDGITDASHALARAAPLGEKRKRGGDPKNDREELHKLLQQPEWQRSPPHLLDAIWTILAKSPFCFLRRQSSRRATHARQGLGDGETGYRRHVGNNALPIGVARHGQMSRSLPLSATFSNLPTALTRPCSIRDAP